MDKEYSKKDIIDILHQLPDETVENIFKVFNNMDLLQIAINNSSFRQVENVWNRFLLDSDLLPFNKLSFEDMRNLIEWKDYRNIRNQDIYLEMQQKNYDQVIGNKRQRKKENS